MPDIPGVTDFFGYDAVTNRFVHIHAHYQLVLGHDRTKKPPPPDRGGVSRVSASTQRLLPTPAPEFEYVVLVIRIVLKYALLDEVLWNALRGKATRPKPSENEELRFPVGFDSTRRSSQPS